MQKVVGSSPISRSQNPCKSLGVSFQGDPPSPMFCKPFALRAANRARKSRGLRQNVAICRETEPTTVCIGSRCCAGSVGGGQKRGLAACVCASRLERGRSLALARDLLVVQSGRSLAARTSLNAIAATLGVSIRSTPAPRRRVRQHDGCNQERRPDTPTPECALSGRW